MITKEKANALIDSSDYISRDLSWLQFNYRVLDQAATKSRTIFERLKFLAITASNLDEFFMIRVGSLYNYLDYNKVRLDYSGLREWDFRDVLMDEIKAFVGQQYRLYEQILKPGFQENGFRIAKMEDLSVEEQKLANVYFKRTVFPMLTPMAYDSFRTFPLLMNQLLIFCVVTKGEGPDFAATRKLSFVQVPSNLGRFLEIEREQELVFVPIEEVIKANINRLFRNVEIVSIDLMRITRNGDYTLEESEDLEADFINEIKIKLQSRKTGRVVRIEVTPGYNSWMMKLLTQRWNLENVNIFEIESLIDLDSLWQIVKHKNFKYESPTPRAPVAPLAFKDTNTDDIFQKIKRRDILLHTPYNSADTLLELLDKATDDPNVLAIKLTIYRLAKDSRVINSLLKAAENGKHVSALFEIKARFDEENNIREAKRLEEAGCFVIHGIGTLKTHTKLLLIVRKEGDKVNRYVHMSSGNYNEDTAKLYTDIGLISSRSVYGQDVSEFFNAITGHSFPKDYQSLIVAPTNMREKLIELTEIEAENARNKLPSGIVIKINSLQDDKFIDALYKASQAGVPIKLIVRGICCLRPGRKGLSENITVHSIVGDFLEHSRIFYFHQGGSPKVYSGSADAMVRSFDRRIESLFQILDEHCLKETINVLNYSFRDNVNSYLMKEDGIYEKIKANGRRRFNSHEEFFKVTQEAILKSKLF